MQKLHAGVLVAVATMVPTLANAQAARGAARPAATMQQSGGPSHEFGVDMVLGYSKPSGGSGTFAIFTPVDVRLGFVSSGSIQPEARMSLSFASGGGTFINFQPGVNLLFKMGSGTPMRGTYLTAGADVQIISSKPSGGTSTSGAIITLNGGIGTRMAAGPTAAKRLEGFVAYSLKNTSLGAPNTFSVGARVGLSFFK